MKSYTAHEIAMMPDWSELRVTKGLSLHRISEETNIPLRKLESIERHDFDAIGTGPFAIGYIRSYAKLLKEDPEIFIQVYKDAITPESSESPAITQSMAVVARRHGQFWRKVNVFHVLGAAVTGWILFVLFTGDEDSGPEPLAAADREIASTLEPMPTKMEDIVEEVEPSREFAERSVQAELEQQLQTSKPNPESLSADAPLPDDSSATALAQSVSAEPAADVVANDVAENFAPQEIGSGDDLLIFSFDEDCWVEVKSADDSVLIAELRRKGDNLRLFGQAPFNILLGNARSVSVTLNGEAVSIEPIKGRKTLRFTARG